MSIPQIKAIPPLQVPVGDIRIPTVNTVRTLEPPVFSTIDPPIVTKIPSPVVDMPGADLPSYEPPRYDPGFRPPARGGNRDKEEEEDSAEEVDRGLDLPTHAMIDVPIIGVEIPVPTSTEVTLAGTTAVASVSAALLGKSLVGQLLKILKPLVKQAILRGKKALGKDLTPYETQLFFALEKTKETKLVLKKLAKEQKEAKQQQVTAHQEQLRQSTPWQKAIEDENKPQT